MDPLAEYTARRDSFRSEQQILQRQFVAIGNLRLAIGLAAAVLAWFVFAHHSVPLWSLLIPVSAFVALVVYHQRIIRRQTLATRAVVFYERGIGRIQDEWMGKGVAGDRFRDPSHVYSEDLDLFGKGGLFDLIAISRTAAGEDALANWLLHPAEQGEAFLRQAAVVELTPKLQLREDLALLAEDVRSDVNV